MAAVEKIDGAAGREIAPSMSVVDFLAPLGIEVVEVITPDGRRLSGSEVFIGSAPDKPPKTQ